MSESRVRFGSSATLSFLLLAYQPTLPLVKAQADSVDSSISSFPERAVVHTSHIMADSQRPSTPPRAAHSGNMPQSPMTPEQVRRMVRHDSEKSQEESATNTSTQEEARLKAKALRAHQLASATQPPPNRTPSGFLAGEKRPHSSISTSSVQPNQRDARQPSSTSAPGADGLTRPRDTGIQAAKKFQKYVEYDFSKMTDTKGGFLTADDDPFNKALHTPNQEDKPAGVTLKEWERTQLLKRLREQKAGPFEPGLSVLRAKEERKTCRECGSPEIDWKWDETFGCSVCGSCRDKMPEKYSLLTKTEAKEDYLLTDPELRDPQLLPHLEKPNPHKSTWNNMWLFLRYQVEDYAFSDKKWGGPEKLDEEFAKRQGEMKRRKEARFKSKLNELKKRTRVDAYKRRKDGTGGASFGDSLAGARHEHEWGRAVENPETGVPVKTCVECGMEVEELEF